MAKRKFKYTLILAILVFNVSVLFAQTGKKYSLTFQPVFGHSPLHLGGSFYKLNTDDSIQFETLKFYISGIELLNDDKIVWKEENSFHLIDASQIQSLSISLNVPSTISFNHVKFNLGIDSATNVSGALGGDLDPTRGMYWTWQSGYINVKLEGKSNLCKTRDNEFEFHLGGYQSPFNSLQTVKLNVKKNETANIALDIEQFIAGIDLSQQNQVAMPGKEAVLLTEKLSKTFNVQHP